MLSQAEHIQQQIGELEAQRRKIKETVRSKCRVLGATVTMGVQVRKLLDRVDVVVVDEAGMVNLLKPPGTPPDWQGSGSYSPVTSVSFRR